MRVRRWRVGPARAIAYLALALGIVGACGSSSATPHSSSSPTNTDGSPAAEIVTAHGMSIDQQIQMYQRIASCIRAAGFNATASRDGVEVGGSLSADQQNTLTQVQAQCNSKYLVQLPPPTPREQQLLYEATIRQATCLEKLTGYVLPPPPSAEVWIESHGGVWSPMDVVIGLLTKDHRMSEIPTAQRDCPYPR